MGSDDDSNQGEAPAPSAAPSSFTMPDFGSIRSQLRSGVSSTIKMSVATTNSALASLQSTSDGIRRPVSSAIQTVEHEGTKAMTACRVVYDRRYEFGPYYVAGAALGVGGIVALRRGRIPGLILGTLAGGITYMSLYEPLTETPVFEWPFKNWKGKLSDLTGMGGGSGGKKE